MSTHQMGPWERKEGSQFGVGQAQIDAVGVKMIVYRRHKCELGLFDNVLSEAMERKRAVFILEWRIWG